jgi:hypothetical protein
MAEPRGIALTIGLNRVFKPAYKGWPGVLNASERDAYAMAALARGAGYEVWTLMTPEATRSEVLDYIAAAADRLKDGDIFLLSFSGHGAQKDNADGGDPDDGDFDEAWCLYDGLLLDDEIHAALTKFSTGVRIVVISDSCFSGTVVRYALQLSTAPSPVVLPSQPVADARIPPGISLRTRFLPPPVMERIVDAYGPRYRAILDSLPKKREFTADLLLLAACREDRRAHEDVENGMFTSILLRVWNGGDFQGNYQTFFRDISDRMPNWQKPVAFPGADVGILLSQRPFSIR